MRDAKSTEERLQHELQEAQNQIGVLTVKLDGAENHVREFRALYLLLRGSPIGVPCPAAVQVLCKSY